MGKGGNCILWGLGPSLLSSQDLRLNLTSPLENGSAGKQELLVEAERGLLHAGCQLSPVPSCEEKPSSLANADFAIQPRGGWRSPRDSPFA